MAEENNVGTNVNTSPVAEAAPAPAPQPAAVQEPATNLRTFTQDQIDAIISRERAKAVKGWFSAEQMAAKDAAIQSLTTERDTARADTDKLKAELDGYKNEKFLASKGIPADALEFYAFKIGKLVTDKKTFEQAAEEYIKENPPANTVRMSTSGGVGGNGQTNPNPNEVMNALIRGATK